MIAVAKPFSFAANCNQDGGGGDDDDDDNDDKDAVQSGVICLRIYETEKFIIDYLIRNFYDNFSAFYVCTLGI